MGSNRSNSLKITQQHSQCTYLLEGIDKYILPQSSTPFQMKELAVVDSLHLQSKHRQLYMFPVMTEKVKREKMNSGFVYHR